MGLKKEQDDLLVIAKIGRPYGVDGRLKIQLHTDFPEQFRAGSSFEVGDRILEVSHFDQKNNVISFVGIHSPDEAAKLTNLVLKTSLDETRKRCKLKKDEFFWFDIVGCAVYDSSELLGLVSSIERYGVIDYLCIDTDAVLVQAGLAKTFLLPYQDRFITTVSISQKRIDALHAKEILLES